LVFDGATVTDANVVLGLIDPDNFLGGRRRLDRAAAEAAAPGRAPSRRRSGGSILRCRRWRRREMERASAGLPAKIAGFANGLGNVMV
jgi:N-methylhydantoinase A/oxoprolinase/acetone carboxylase beta subunit